MKQQTALRAGAAWRDISPKSPMPLAGYPNVIRISAGVHDPLLASVLFLENQGRAVLLASLDLLLVDPPLARRWRKAVAAALDLPEAAVFISCTHTHSSPVTAMKAVARRQDPTAADPDPEYLGFVEYSLVGAARAAAKSATPAELAWTTACASGVGCNRHAADGPHDPEAGVLAVRATATRQMLALSVIYGMHPTVMHEDSKLVSSDFPHYARETLRARFRDGLTVCYHNAPSGNLSPRHVVKGQTFAEAERLGAMLGETVAAAVGKLPDAAYATDVSLDFALRAVELPMRELPEAAVAEATLAAYRKKHAELVAHNAPRPDIRTAECAVFGAERLVKLAAAKDAIRERMEAYRPLELQVVRAGGACLAGLPGEIFVEYALRLKAAVPHTFPVCLANGELQGYIVTREAAAAGGYEAAGCVLAPEAGDIMVETAAEMARRLLQPGSAD